MPTESGKKRQAISVEQAGKSKSFLRITLDCGHVLSHIQKSNFNKTKGYHLCSECLEAQNNA